MIFIALVRKWACIALLFEYSMLWFWQRFTCYSGLTATLKLEIATVRNDVILPSN